MHLEQDAHFDWLRPIGRGSPPFYAPFPHSLHPGELPQHTAGTPPPLASSLFSSLLITFFLFAYLALHHLIPIDHHTTIDMPAEHILTKDAPAPLPVVSDIPPSLRSRSSLPSLIAIKLERD